MQFLADENFNNQIIRGVLRQNPNVDVVRLQDVGLSEADDPTVLEWATQQGRVEFKVILSPLTFAVMPPSVLGRDATVRLPMRIRTQVATAHRSGLSWGAIHDKVPRT